MPNGDEGLAGLLTHILPGKALHLLSLEDCLLTDESAERLLQLAPSLTCTHLYLGNNAIQDPQLRRRLQETLCANFDHLESIDSLDETIE